eukprot:1256-Heterococcus_DN1.PRE.1
MTYTKALLRHSNIAQHLAPTKLAGQAITDLYYTLVGLAVHGAAVVGFGVTGAAVVGFAVHGAAVVGLGVAVRDSIRTRGVATQGSAAHQTIVVRVNSYCILTPTDQTPVIADLTLRRRKLVTSI